MRRHPYNDPSHEKAAGTRHIRLISEGGSSLAKSPSPICIDSIQVAHGCTTESQHMVYRSATGACAMFSTAPSFSLFSVPLDYVAELDAGDIPDDLCTRFEQSGNPLSDTARIEVLETGKSWAIRDRDTGYAIREGATKLVVNRNPE